jgi:hypothetical protein
VKDHIKINRRYEQKLGDVTEEQVIAEGFDNTAEFKKEWVAITKKPWNPEQIVTAYDFEVYQAGNSAK